MTRAAEVAWDRVLAASMEPMAVIDGDQYAVVNQPYADLYDCSGPEDLAGELWEQHLARTERDRFEREILPTCRRDGQWRGRIEGRRSDGGTFIQELSVGHLVEEQFICHARAAADEGRTRGEFERNERLVEQVFDAVDDVVYVFDEDGNLVLWNEALREMTGYTDGEIETMDPTELISVEQHEAWPGQVVPIDEPGDQHGHLDLAIKDGDPIPHAFRARTFEDPETGRVYHCCITRDVTERTRHVGDPHPARRLTAELVENAPFGIVRLDDQLRITYANPRAAEMIGLPDDEAQSSAIGMDVRAIPPVVDTGQAERFTRLKDGEPIEFEIPLESIDGRDALMAGRGVALSRDGEFDGAVLAAVDMSERKQYERELERQRDELETLNRITEFLLETTHELFDSPARHEMEQTVCDCLAGSELYQVAWIGEPAAEKRRIVPRACAGIDEAVLEAVSIPIAPTDADGGPTGLAYRTGEPQASHDIRTDPAVDAWRDEALDRGIQSGAAVPLSHGDRTYGILTVYATRPLAFGRRELTVFEIFGEAIGFVIHSIENHKLLFTDRIVELEFEVTDSSLVFVQAAEHLECELTITGYLESTSGNWSVYLAVDGASPTAVRDVALEDPDVDRVRIVADQDGSGLLELEMNGRALKELTEYEAILTSGHVESGRGRFCIETPRTTDVRELVTRLQATYPDSTLVAQREFDRPVQKAVELRQSIEDRLTDRQQEALERAYHAGYFEWPRQSTAGDVAASMDLAETTFHYHLRHALDTLLAILAEFDER